MGVVCYEREKLERSTQISKAGEDWAGHCEEDEGPDGEVDGANMGGTTEGVAEGVISEQQNLNL
jgi:hypothetical protein